MIIHPQSVVDSGLLVSRVQVCALEVGRGRGVCRVAVDAGGNRLKLDRVRRRGGAKGRKRSDRIGCEASGRRWLTRMLPRARGNLQVLVDALLGKDNREVGVGAGGVQPHRVHAVSGRSVADAHGSLHLDRVGILEVEVVLAIIGVCDHKAIVNAVIVEVDWKDACRAFLRAWTHQVFQVLVAQAALVIDGEVAKSGVGGVTHVDAVLRLVVGYHDNVGDTVGIVIEGRHVPNVANIVAQEFGWVVIVGARLGEHQVDAIFRENGKVLYPVIVHVGNLHDAIHVFGQLWQLEQARGATGTLEPVDALLGRPRVAGFWIHVFVILPRGVCARHVEQVGRVAGVAASAKAWW